jgi:hypothetical protein
VAKTAGTVLTNVLTRVRDPNATGAATNTPPTTVNGQTFGFAQISQAQNFVNAATEIVLDSATLALTAGTAIYPVFSNLPDAIRITTVRDFSQSDLFRCDWRTFGRSDRMWLVTPSYPRSWAVIGHDLLAVVPVVNSVIKAQIGSLTVQYISLTTAVTTGTDTFDLPDSSLGPVETMTELFLRLKTRQLGGFVEAFGRLQKQLGKAAQNMDNDLDTGAV